MCKRMILVTIISASSLFSTASYAQFASGYRFLADSKFGMSEIGEANGAVLCAPFDWRTEDYQSTFVDPTGAIRFSTSVQYTDINDGLEIISNGQCDIIAISEENKDLDRIMQKYNLSKLN